MKRNGFIFLIGLISLFNNGCGYATRSLNLGGAKTVFIEPFKNRISFGDENRRNIYLPLLENKITNIIADRFLFDGNLKIADRDKADLILQGELIDYRRDALRYTENEDVEEYRITITISMTLWDNAAQKPRWSEPSFAGSAEYFTTGSLAKSETVALEDALKDLAKRVVERTIEDW